jgi:predicted CXXCH cytochrome family protein
MDCASAVNLRMHWEKKAMKKITELTLCSALCIVLSCFILPSQIWAVENSDCFECHSDEELSKESTDNILHAEITESLYVNEDKFNYSVHNVNGITCIDCHSDIEDLDYDDEVPHAKYLKAVCCASCHEESGEEFKNSVHMKMRSKGITMTCYACHGYHYVKQMETASVAERENSICLKCHNPFQYHKWLPSSEAHFSYVECVVCHAPDVPRHINLKFFDLVTNKFYGCDDLLAIMGIDYDEFMPTIDKNKDGIINQDEFDDLILMFKQKNIHAVLHAELVADINS